MTDRVTRWFSPIFGWMRRPEDRSDTEDRAAIARILLTVIWLPVQITLSLLFATGGIFLVLILGMVLAPFVGLFFLIRHAVREPDSPTSETMNGEERSGT